MHITLMIMWATFASIVAYAQVSYMFAFLALLNLSIPQLLSSASHQRMGTALSIQYAVNRPLDQKSPGPTVGTSKLEQIFRCHHNRLSVWSLLMVPPQDDVMLPPPFLTTGKPSLHGDVSPLEYYKCPALLLHPTLSDTGTSRCVRVSTMHPIPLGRNHTIPVSNRRPLAGLSWPHGPVPRRYIAI